MDSNTNTAGSKAARTPSHVAYHVRDAGEGRKGFWTRIGAAWANADGKGFSIQLDVVPLDGRVVLRLADEKTE